MPSKVPQYKKEIGRINGHSDPSSYIMVDPHPLDSWASPSVSLVVCLIVEYSLESHYEAMISGIVFPTGYLLFWAFYYSYYRPSELRAAWTNSKMTKESGFLVLLFQSIGLLVKAILRDLAFRLGLNKKNAWYGARNTAKDYMSYFYRSRKLIEVGNADSEDESAKLPKEIINTLAILELPPCRDWRIIHRRYRELAKKYHPDLNEEITAGGTRFMIYDTAYKKLCSVRSIYFTG